MATTEVEILVQSTAPTVVSPTYVPVEVVVQGPQGIKGDKGTLAIGTVTTGAAGSSALVTNTGTSTDGVLNFTIPQGLKGDKGDKGDTGTLQLGTVSTGAAGTNALITNTGTPTNGIFNFTIPKGDKGDTGTLQLGTVTTGAAGSSVVITNTGTATNGIFNFTIPRGDTGATGTIAVGTVTTGAAGSSATVSNSGTSTAAIFNFTIPQGIQGIPGSKWYAAAGVPANGSYVLGDWYLNTTTSDVYEKTGASAWTLRTNIKGATGTLSLGTVSTGAAGSAASITNTGTPTAGVFNFVIPQGIQGVQGPSGTITLGTVSTGAAGSAASITNSGSSTNAVFNFTIPQGVQGIQGIQGPSGTMSVGTVTTGAVGSNATVTNSGTASAAVWNFTFPRGAGVQVGGTAGQFLRKNSATDFDTAWVDAPVPLNMVTTDTPQSISGAKTFTARVTAAEFEATDDFIGPRGSATNVGYGFSDNGDTGMWSAGVNLLNFATGGVDRIALTTTTETHGLPMTINNTLTVNNPTVTIGSTTVGSTNTLNFANPGVGGTQQFQFLRATDSAGIRVTEATTDQILYQFYMSDNPDQADDFSWFVSDHQGTGGSWEPIRIGTVSTNFRASNHNFFGNINQRTAPWYSSNGVQDTVYMSRTGTLTVTPGVTGYTGTTAVYWTIIDGTPLGNVTGLTATAVADGASTLAAATYYYTVTAVNASGETLVSNEPSVVTAAGQRVDLAWALPTGTSASAITYNVYRNTVANTNASRVRVATGLTVRTYSDAGAATTAVVPPTTNTTKNTFRWGNGATNTANVATGVVVTGAAQTLNNGATVTFSATTGGVVGDLYQWRAYAGGTINAGIVRGTQVFDNGSRVFSAQNYNHATTVTSEITYGLAAAVGTGTAYARNDHAHGTVPAQTITGGTGITATLSGVNYTLANTGVTSLVAGTNATVSAATGAVTIGMAANPVFTSTTDGVVQFNGGAADGTVWLYGQISGVQKFRQHRNGSLSITALNVYNGNVLSGGATASITGAGVITGSTIYEGANRVYSAGNPQPMTGYATETWVDDRVNALVDAAPGTLDTLNELAAALGDDPNFATTVTNNINTRALDTDVVHKAGAETVTGTKTFTVGQTFSAMPEFTAGANAAAFRASGSNDHVFISLYARAATPATRSAYFGFASNGTTTLTINNEAAGGINLTGGNVTVTSGNLLEGSNRVYSAGNANLASTVAAATTYGLASVVGTGTAYARNDHHHGTPPAQTISVSGSGITATLSGVNYTLANTGVTSNVAGTGISVSAATGAVTITNTGATSVAGRTGAVTLTAADIGGGTFPSAGFTFPGTITSTSAAVLTATASNAGIELGSTTAANTPFIDFHSSGGTEDYSARIVASGGTAGTLGSGTLSLTAASVSVSNTLNTVGNLSENGNRVYSLGNKVPIAGLSATGTASATTYLRGDNTWAAAPVTSVNTRTGAVTGLAEANAVVDLTTAQTVGGAKTFSALVTASADLSVRPGAATATVTLGDGTFTKTSGSGFTFNSSIVGTSGVFDGTATNRVYSPTNAPVQGLPFHVGGTVGTGLKAPKFIAPAAMTLRSARCWIDTEAANGTSFQIYVNGAAVSGTAYTLAAAATQYLYDFPDVNIVAGDRVQVFVNTADATATELSVTVEAVTR